MAIVDVTRMWSKDGGSISSEKADPFDKQYSYTEAYQVLSDDPEETEDAVLLDGRIPNIGNFHRSGGIARCTSIRASKIGPVFWMVEVGYEGEDLDGAVEVEWSDAVSTEPIDREWNGAAILTANGEQVEGLTVEIADPVVIIKRKFLSINLYAIRAYRRATNADTFLGWPPGTARLVGYSARNRFRFGDTQELWDVTARIQFREPFNGTTAAQAWYKRWRHEGLWERRGGVVQRALDLLGQEVTKPVLLTNTGEREFNPQNAVFRHTQVYGSLPYSALGLV